MDPASGNDSNDGKISLQDLDVPQRSQSEGVETAAASPAAAAKRPRDDDDGVDRLQGDTQSKRSKTNGDGADSSSEEARAATRSSSNEKRPKEAEAPSPQAARASVFSPVVTRSRRSGNAAISKESKPLGNASKQSASVEGNEKREPGRWRVHQMAEDYVGLVGRMMYPVTKFRPYGYDSNKREYPLEEISLLGYLQSALRRPTIIERWSPYEISLFEAALLHHGKEFHLVSRIIGTKSTKDVIDFYYIWKKTEHYKKWKDKFVPDSDLVDIDSPVKGGKT